MGGEQAHTTAGTHGTKLRFAKQFCFHSTVRSGSQLLTPTARGRVRRPPVDHRARPPPPRPSQAPRGCHRPSQAWQHIKRLSTAQRNRHIFGSEKAARGSSGDARVQQTSGSWRCCAAESGFCMMRWSAATCKHSAHKGAEPCPPRGAGGAHARAKAHHARVGERVVEVGVAHRPV